MFTFYLIENKTNTFSQIGCKVTNFYLYEENVLILKWE